MNIEDNDITNDLLGDFSLKQKKLLNANRILITAASIVIVVILHMYIIVSPIPEVEKEKTAFLALFTLTIAAPIASFILSVGLAFIPIKEETYLQKFLFFALIILLLIEVTLLFITLMGG